jgi:hypothetical protein
MVADYFRLRGRSPNIDEIDRGAEALRDLMQGGKKLTDWEKLPPSRKKKWIACATVVLNAALR